MGMLDYQPLVLVDTTDLPRDEWLAYRRKGIGGSDAAAVLGISPFMTARDLYYDKLGISAQADEENWVAKEIGHLLEPLVARIFEKRTGLKIYQRKVMFQHPQYPWMLADLDYLVEMPDGSRAILECKTTTSNSADNWWYAGKEIVPVYYESQGRHYMAVTNIDRVYFCCLLTDSREAIIRCMDRDMAYCLSRRPHFWNNRNTGQRDGVAIRKRSRAVKLLIWLVAPPEYFLGCYGNLHSPGFVRKKVFLSYFSFGICDCSIAWRALREQSSGCSIWTRPLRLAYLGRYLCILRCNGHCP